MRFCPDLPFVANKKPFAHAIEDPPVCVIERPGGFTDAILARSEGVVNNQIRIMNRTIKIIDVIST